MAMEDAIARRYEALIRIAISIRSQKTADDLFQVLVRELGHVVPLDAMAQFDETANRIRWHLGPSSRVPKESLHGINRDESLAMFVYREQKPVSICAVDQDIRFPATVAVLREIGLQSACGLPLTTAHRKLGSLVIASAKANMYSADEVRFCALVADQIALAMDDAISVHESQRDRERLQLLLDLTNHVVSNLNLRDVLREVSAQIRAAMHCDGCGVLLPHPEDGKLRVYALDFPDAPAVIEEGYEPPNAAAAPIRAFREGAVVILLPEEICRTPFCDQLHSVVFVPIIGSNGVRGVITLGARREAAFGPADIPFLTQIGRQIAIAIENARAFGEVSELKNKLAQENLYLEDEIRTELKFDEIVGRSESLRRVLEQIETVAPTDSTVLIYGETGSGKELIARAVHNLSARKSAAFVKLNCAAIPTGLLESELFGHERGAFTGAISQRIGRFELANRGTMFLDEIGEVPLDLQPKLLRVLQEREFERLGSTRTLRTDARLIAATNRDLAALVAEQKFRSDLYYRLNVFPVRVPALRERSEDIPLLVRHFAQQFSRRLAKTIDAIPSDTMSALVRYPWPGNIRELQNVIERAVILSNGPVLRVSTDDLRPSNQPLAELVASNDGHIALGPNSNMREALEEAERQQILSALEQANWVIAGPAGAATRLGLKRTTLQSRMQKLGIRISRTIQ